MSAPTTPFQLFVLRSDAIGDRLVSLTDRLPDYEAGRPVTFEPSARLATAFTAPAPPPELVVRGNSRLSRAGDDVNNAIKLHDWLRNALPNRRAQRDNRLWTWLAHEVFADYCRRRWPVTSAQSVEARLNNVRDHWFLRGEGRGAVGNHALARLWWGVEATMNPETVDVYFAPKAGDDDPYRLTRMLLGYQNAYLQIRDRSFGASPIILLSALESLRQLKRDGVAIDGASAVLGKEINLVSRYRNLDGMRPHDLVALFRELARRV